MSAGRRALVLGGYGLIGSACMAALAQAGFAVTGVGRSQSAAMAADATASWAIRDIPSITVAEWRDLLDGVDVVVNAAGALQDGARDGLHAIHVGAVERLTEAMNGGPARMIQISAAGVSPMASTWFFRTKAQGDAIIAAECGDWVILRPCLVLSPQAYGGTALLRAAAALPAILPRVYPGSQVQTVHVDDVAAAVVLAAEGGIDSFTVADLTETQSRPLPEMTTAIRAWLGLPPARFSPLVPEGLLRLAGKGADLLGKLGWRSPMRSTALMALKDGIRGDPQTWTEAGGAPCRSLEASLATLQATRQERLFARMFLALPMAIGILSVFWLVSGMTALFRPSAAMEVLTGRGTSAWIAAPLVLFGAVADIVLGLGILVRRYARAATFGMAALSLAYLAGSLVAAPDLWADPMGPMLKVLPGIVLALIVWAALEER